MEMDKEWERSGENIMGGPRTGTMEEEESERSGGPRTGTQWRKRGRMGKR
jgi:hypothetical protein